MADVSTKALLLQIDASVALLQKNLQAGDAAVAQFQKSAEAKLTSMEIAFTRLGTMAEGAAKKFETLRAGLDAIGLVLPALVLGEMAKKGLEFAASIAEQAKQAGISAEKLQQLRYVATQTGVSQEALQTTLVRLSQNLGKAELGSTKMQKAFEAVGISQTDLKNHTATVDEAFAKLSDKMHALGPSAQAAGLAATVIGRSWAEAAPMLYAGSARIDELSEAAKRLGIVLSNEQIQHAEETAHKLKELEMVLSAKIAGIVADNAGSIMSLASAFGSLVSALSKIDPQKLKTVIGALVGGKVGSFLGAPGRIAGTVIGAAYGYGSSRPAQDYADAANEHIHEMRRLAGTYGFKGDGSASDHAAIQRAEKDPRFRDAASHARIAITLMHGAEARDGGSFAAPPEEAGGGGADLPNFLGGGGKHHKEHDDTLERARAAEEESYNLAKRELDERKQILQATEKLTIDTEDRQSLALQAIDLDHDQKALEIQHNLRMIELDKKLGDTKKRQAETEAQKQLALNDQLSNLRKQEVYLQAELAREQTYERFAQQELDSKTSYLQIEESLAQTAAERRAIELQILDLTYQAKKQALERIQNDTFTWYDSSGEAHTEFAHNADDREAARRDEHALDRAYPLQKQQTLLNTGGPMDQFLRSIPDTAAKATEALQNVEVQGLQSISQGIIDVITGTKSLGQAFHDIANQIISDLLRIGLEKAVIGPLANMLFGGGGGGWQAGASSFFDAVNGFGGAFAAGGDPPLGVPSLVGERGPELFVPKVPGTIIPNHALGGGGALTVQISLDSDMLHAKIVNGAGQVMAAAAPAFIAGAHGRVMKTLTRPGING